MLRATVSGFFIFLLGASFVFTLSASAHNIDLKKAREIAREYARQVPDESGGRYAHYSTNCVRAFPNHNHYVRCLIDYQSAADTQKGVVHLQGVHRSYDGGPRWGHHRRRVVDSLGEAYFG